MKKKFIQFLLLSFFVFGSFKFGQAEQVELDGGAIGIVRPKDGNIQLVYTLPEQYQEMVSTLSVPVEVTMYNDKGGATFSIQTTELSIELPNNLFSQEIYYVTITISDFFYSQKIILP